MTDWISVNDRLPALDEPILIWCGYAVVGYRNSDSDDPEDHNGWMLDLHNEAGPVTHWAEISSPAAAGGTDAG